MSNAVLPVLQGLAWNVGVQPEFSTKVQRAVSGRELRGAFMAYPLWNFSLTYEVLVDGIRGTDFDTLAGFFLARRGQWDNFLYTNPLDNTVSAMPSGNTAASKVTYQLTRDFGAGSFTFTEPVMNINGTPQIYLGGALQVVGTNYNMNSLGQVVFTSQPTVGLALTWTGSFYYRCRFKQDVADFNNFMKDLLELKKLEFVGAPGNKV